MSEIHIIAKIPVIHKPQETEAVCGTQASGAPGPGSFSLTRSEVRHSIPGLQSFQGYDLLCRMTMTAACL